MRTIIKLSDNKYIAWSSICDAPTTMVCDKEQIREMLIGEYCSELVNKIDTAIKRADEYGTSTQSRENAKDFLSFNRAGENESCISLEHIIEKYSAK